MLTLELLQTLHSELDEPATLSVGVDGMAGEEDRVPSLSGVKLWRVTWAGNIYNVSPSQRKPEKQFDTLRIITEASQKNEIWISS